MESPSAHENLVCERGLRPPSGKVPQRHDLRRWRPDRAPELHLQQLDTAVPEECDGLRPPTARESQRRGIRVPVPGPAAVMGFTGVEATRPVRVPSDAS